jgi:hypothetical protein
MNELLLWGEEKQDEFMQNTGYTFRLYFVVRLIHLQDESYALSRKSSQGDLTGNQRIIRRRNNKDKIEKDTRKVNEEFSCVLPFSQGLLSRDGSTTGKYDFQCHQHGITS